LGNETFDHLARQGSLSPLIGPESVLGISAKVVREVIRGRMNKKHDEYCQSIYGHRQAIEGFLKRTYAL
jgi:hypothetical protein